MHALLKDIGVDVGRFNTAYDRDFYKRNNLGAVTYFNKKTFGKDKVVRHPYCNYPNYIEGLMAGNWNWERVAPALAKGGSKGKY